MNKDISRFLYQDAFKNKKKSRLGQKVIKPREPKVYPEIEYEFRKKIQERLSRLQINLRQIFDNISILKKNKTKENVKKINEQIKKARELTNYVRHLADDVRIGRDEFKNSFNRPKSSSPKKQKFNTNTNLNLNNSFTNTSYNSLNMLPQNNISYYRTMNNPSFPNNNENNVINNNIYNNQSYNTMNSTNFPNNQNNIINNNNNNTMNTNNTINNLNNENNNFNINTTNNFNNNSNNNTNYSQNNFPPKTTQLAPNQTPQLDNQLEYSSTSIGSNINPMNSFSSNVNNISLVHPNNQNNNTLPNNIQNTNNISYNNTFPQPQPQSNNVNSKTNIYIQSQNFNPIIEEPNEEANINVSSTVNRSINQNQLRNTNNIPNNTNTQSIVNNSLHNTQRLTSQNINPKIQNQTQNSNYFLQSTNTLKDTPKTKTNIKPKTSFNYKSNTNRLSKINPLTSTIRDSKMITISLDEPSYFKKKKKNSQTFRGTTSISIINPKKSDILTESHVINDMNQTINHVPMQAEEMKVNTQNYIEDERYSAFNAEFPVNYYYELTKEHEPPKHKEWYIRPHHTETFVESNNAIPDDIMNTKYISYYAPASTEKKKTRQDILEELIMETRSHINELQEDMFKKANLNPEGEKLYNKLEGLKEEAKNSFIPGYRDAKEAKQKNIFDMLKDPNSKKIFMIF